MARPKKVGLEYFPLDCQMDDKVLMLEAEHGLEGFAVYIKLLQSCYQIDDGKLDMSVIFRWKTLGKTYGIPAENLRIMVETMFEIGLFCRKTFEEEQKLTSSGIQKRLSQVNSMRERERNRKKSGNPAENESFPAENDTKGKEKKKESKGSKKEPQPLDADAPGETVKEVTNREQKKKNNTPPGSGDPPSVVSAIRTEIEQRSPGYYWSAKDATAAQQLADKLRNRIRNRQKIPPNQPVADADVMTSLTSLLDVLPGLTDYFQFTDMPSLNRKFNEIITQLINKPVQQPGAYTNPSAGGKPVKRPAYIGPNDLIRDGPDQRDAHQDGNPTTIILDVE